MPMVEPGRCRCSRRMAMDRPCKLVLVLWCFLVPTGVAFELLDRAEFSSLDGFGNSLFAPDRGAASSPYIAQCGVDSTVHPQQAPIPRDVSNVLLDLANAAGLGGGAVQSELVGYWGQFLTKDITKQAEQSVSVPLVVPKCDERFDFTCTGTNTLPGFNRMERDASAMNFPVNEVSHFIDASHIYGTSSTLASLREFSGGRLKMDASGLYPQKDASTGRYLLAHTGGNSNPVIAALFILFFREHNRMATELSRAERGQSDDRLFWRARQHVAGLIQQITYEEYLPVLLGDSLPAYKGFNGSVDPRIDLAFSAAAYRYGHFTLNGLVRLMDARGDTPARGNILLRDTFFNLSIFSDPDGFDQILRGSAFVADSEVELRMCDDLRNEFTTPEVFPARYDLGAVDIARGRDAALPRYHELHTCFGLGPVASEFAEAFGEENGARLARLYGAPQTVDPLVGMVAEPQGEGSTWQFLPPLLRTVLRDQFLRLRDGDRFHYGRYAKEARARLQGLTLSEVMKRNSNVSCLPANMFLTSKLSECFGGSGTMDAAAVLQYDHGLTLLPNAMKMYWSIVDGDTLSVMLLGQTSGYLAIGFGATGMRDADVVYGSVGVDGTVECTDGRIPRNDRRPVADSQANLLPGSVSGFEANGVSGIKFQRKLNTGDPDDFVIPATGPVNVIFAIGASDTLAYHGAGRRGVGSIDFGTGMGSTSTGDSGQLFTLRMFHGLVMITSWFVLYPIGIIIARYFKHRRGWMSLHMTANASGTIGAASLAFSTLATSNPLQKPTHGLIGLAVCFCMFLMLALGWYARKGIQSQTHAWIRCTHRVLGRAMVLFAPFQCWLGIRQLFPEGRERSLCEALLFSWTGALAVAVLALEINMRRQLSRAPAAMQSVRRFSRESTISLKPFTWEEIAKKTAGGAQWVVISNTVYDVRNWIDDHPGGRAVLLHCLGTDVTREFLGDNPFKEAKWAQEPCRALYATAMRQISFSSSHTHSRAAAQQLKGMEVGRLEATKPRWPAHSRPPHAPPSTPSPVPPPSPQYLEVASELLDSSLPLANSPPTSGSESPSPRPADAPQQRNKSLSVRQLLAAASLRRSSARPPPQAPELPGPSAASSEELALQSDGCTSPESRTSERPLLPPQLDSHPAFASPAEVELEVSEPRGSFAMRDGAEGTRGEEEEAVEEQGPDEEVERERLRRAPLLARRAVNASEEEMAFELVLGLQAGEGLVFRPGESVEVQAVVDRQIVVRSYTPVAWDTRESGTLRLVVKLAVQPYLGVMSNYLLNGLRLGEQLRFHGPHGQPREHPTSVSGCFEKVMYVCGGSGVTEALLLLDYYEARARESRVTVLCSAHTLEDIICRDELEAHVRRRGGRVQVRYTLTGMEQAPDGWRGYVGRVNEQMLRETLAAAKDHARFLRDDGEESSSRRRRQSLGQLSRWLPRNTARRRSLLQLDRGAGEASTSRSRLELDPDDLAAAAPSEGASRETSWDERTSSEPELSGPTRIFICGPNDFESHVRRLCLVMGIDDDQIEIGRTGGDMAARAAPAYRWSPPRPSQRPSPTSLAQQHGALPSEGRGPVSRPSTPKVAAADPDGASSPIAAVYRRQLQSALRPRVKRGTER